MWGPGCSSWVYKQRNKDDRGWPNSPLVQFNPWGLVVVPRWVTIPSSAVTRVFLSICGTVLLVILTTACGGESTTYLCTTTENEEGSPTVSCPATFRPPSHPMKTILTLMGPTTDRILPAQTDRSDQPLREVLC